MSIDVVFFGANDGDDGPFALSSAVGWNLFCQWASAEPVLKQLSETGRFQGTDKLSQSLHELLIAEPPESPEVESTAKYLLELMGVGDPDETIEVGTEFESPDQDSEAS